MLLTGTLRTPCLTWLSAFVNDHPVSCHENRNANLLFTTFKYDGQISLAPTSFWYDGYNFSRSEAMPSRRFHTKHRHGCKQCKTRRVKVRLICRNPYCELFIELEGSVTLDRHASTAHVDKSTAAIRLFCRTNHPPLHLHLRPHIHLPFHY